jgi:hypothetical protein
MWDFVGQHFRSLFLAPFLVALPQNVLAIYVYLSFEFLGARAPAAERRDGVQTARLTQPRTAPPAPPAEGRRRRGGPGVGVRRWPRGVPH